MNSVVTRCGSCWADAGASVRRAEKRTDPLLTGRNVGWIINRLIEIDVVIDILLFEIRQDLCDPAHMIASPLFGLNWSGVILSPRGQHFMSHHIIVQSQADLHHVVFTLSSSRSFASLLNSREQQRN